MDDKEIQDEIKVHMQEILMKRVEDNMQSLGHNQVTKSLDMIRLQKFKLKKANLTSLNELIDEFLTADEKVDISPLLIVYDEMVANTKL